MYDDRERGAPA